MCEQLGISALTAKRVKGDDDDDDDDDDDLKNIFSSAITLLIL